MSEGASQREPEVPPGAALEKYRLIANIGAGGMADVYLALSRGALGFSKLVVIKRLRGYLTSNEAYVSMFLDEARLAARLNHPHVVQTYDVWESDGRYSIAMEYLEGQPLSSLSHAAEHGLGVFSTPPATALPTALAVRIVADALDGLHYAHELADFDGTPLRIVHRDMSPQNVFVTYDGVVKILDFGVAKAAMNTSMTRAGTVKGKTSYMAPEQALGDALDRRVDVFAVGIVLWELLTGQRLFRGDALSAMSRLLHDPIPPPSALRPAVAEALERIVMKALMRDPEDRYASALEMRDALEEHLRASGESVTRHDVAAAMKGTFAVAREEIRRRVQAQVGAPPTVTSASHLPTLTLRPPELTSQAGSAPQARGEGAESNASMSRSVSMRTPASRVPVRWVVAWAAAIVIVAIGCAALGVLSRRPPMVASAGARAAAPIATSIATPALVPTPIATPSATQAPAQISIPDTSATPPLARGRAARPPGSAVAKAAAAPVIPVASAPAAPDCSAPFYVDERGVRRPRAECL